MPQYDIVHFCRRQQRVVTVVAACLCVVGVARAGSYPYLSWQDEFDGSAVESSLWAFDIGTGANLGLTGRGNNELQYYTSRSQNAAVGNGRLTITARAESYGGMAYTSARLKTQGLFSQKGGRFEMRAALPLGQGLWPAFWMLPESETYGGWAASGEIDIMEARGQTPTQVSGAIHYGGSWPANVLSQSSVTLPAGQTIADFHTYAVEWDVAPSPALRWYVDDTLYATKTGWWSSGGAYPAPFDKPFSLLLNLAVGGDYVGSPNGATAFPSQLIVDYVRVSTAAPPAIVFNVASGTQTQAAGGRPVIAAAASVTKNGAGTLTLSAGNTYTGDTSILAGRLTLTGNGVIGGGAYGGAIANAGELVFGSDAAQSISGVISGTGNVSKSGLGQLTLSGANTFSGVMAITGGVVSIASWNNSASNGVWGNRANDTAQPTTSLIQLSGGRINYTGTTASGSLRGVNLASGTTTLDIASGATLHFGQTNSFQSNGGSLVKDGAGTLQLGSAGVANTIFSGKVVVNAGTLDWFDGSSMPGPATLVSDFLTVNDGGSFALGNSAGSSTVSARIGFKLSGNATLRSDRAGTGHTISGPITDGATPGLLRKAGAGVLALAGVNTYSGGTQVNAGELRVNGVLGAGAVSVASDAVLGGGGVIGGPVSIQRGGVIAPGNSPGTLTVNNSFTLAEGAILRFELNPTNRVSGGGVNDLITGVTNLTLDGILNVTGVGDWTTLPGNAAWRLFTYSGILTDNGVTLGAMPTLSGGQSFAIDVTTPGEVNLVVVPEPSVAALITVGLAGIAAICGANAANCGGVRGRRRAR